jgi:ribosome modulation factor
MKTPPRFELWNPALRGAYAKGYRAAEAGSLISSCPYEDKRKPSGRLTWSRSFIAAWRDGFAAGDDARKSQHITDYYANASGRSIPPFRR